MTTLLKTPAPPKTAKLDRLTRQVNETLERLLPKTASSPQVMAEAMRYCVLSGGKRFRPLLVLGACEAVGASLRQALPVACAVELIHTYSIVHDDLPAMDNADQRRGQPSCHRKFGEGNAILVGDALLTLAFETLSRNGTPNALAIIRTLGEASGTNGLIGGQVMDLQAISQPRMATERVLEDIARLKTASLIAAGVVAGALAGGGSSEQVKRLQRYGQTVGLAFQLIDDMHDRDGLAQVIGMETAKTASTKMIARATDALEPFKARAGVLRQLTEWLASTA